MANIEFELFVGGFIWLVWAFLVWDNLRDIKYQLMATNAALANAEARLQQIAVNTNRLATFFEGRNVQIER